MELVLLVKEKDNNTNLMNYVYHNFYVVNISKGGLSFVLFYVYLSLLFYFPQMFRSMCI